MGAGQRDNGSGWQDRDAARHPDRRMRACGLFCIMAAEIGMVTPLLLTEALLRALGESGLSSPS
jgi:hypothetical protein